MDNEDIPQVRSAPSRPTTGTRVRKFAAPDELAAEFGTLTQTEDRIQGVVETKNVRALLDAFGLQERSEVVFPFQHMKKQHGEIWAMRIEPASAHTLDGQPMMGHQWVYHQAQPERVGSQQ